jgi:hypothetical protein
MPQLTTAIASAIGEATVVLAADPLLIWNCTSGFCLLVRI